MFKGKEIDYNDLKITTKSLIVPAFILNLEDEFKKHVYEKLKKIVIETNAKKWLIHSDYSFNDKSKPNDVVTFTLFPDIMDINQYKNLIMEYAPKDIKEIREVEPQFVNFLKESSIINISFILNKKRRFFLNDKDFFIKKIECLIHQLDVWINNCKTKDEQKKLYMDDKKDLEHYLCVIKRNSNLRLIRDIEIVTLLVCFIGKSLITMTDLKMIGWFSDRDAILNFQDKKFLKPIIFTLIEYSHFLMCQDCGLKKYIPINVGLPEKEGEMFYDELNRIPDFIAATLADINFETKECSHKKYIPLIKEILTSDEKNYIFKIDFKTARARYVNIIPKN